MKRPEVFLPKRKKESHKGDYGRVFILAGSVGFTGAAYLAAESAVRGGAGLVTLGVPEVVNPVLEVKTTCAMTLPLPCREGALDERGLETVLEWLSRSTVFVFGPGLSQREGVKKLITALLPRLSLPFVADADGLNVLCGEEQLLRDCQASGILTPHVGEFARLSGYSKEEVLQFPVERAKEYAKKVRKIVVLKRYPTVVTDGERVYLNESGNPGMATGGSGDVLTGLLGALLAQGLSPWECAVLGTFLHGRAGDLAAREKGQIGMNAEDLLEFLPKALLEHHGF